MAYAEVPKSQEEIRAILPKGVVDSMSQHFEDTTSAILVDGRHHDIKDRMCMS